MFGMGFFEILMIAVVAIIFLGPEKLPKALVDMAKFLRVVKKTMDDAKESLEREVNLNKIKEEALAYKNSITQEAQSISKDLELKDLNLDLEPNSLPQQKENPQTSQTATKDSTLETPSHSQSREIQPNKLDKTTLSFGENLTEAQPQTQTTRNENV
ncbi:MAG: Sec-independent protein translocase protein TatB [Helicobacter sp.]|uniref:Sec-independent protein translocase protein TatB n=1 Tax=Helicobacter sp. TaxID=218 RepID=UPI0023D29D02|nr:Sec-independent protein translocase protein TatB [Helicobacter sp.]MDE5926265.1 Sec-independent protein translocase protein TatB [Helicobacter sp.]MDE7174510.1 Sec-independent protein translocase protein TatB [Helicobacter sp.]